tara:strand:+ start:354 stop:1436 length:1083 start_codon:yes stop_codon:yes gene_type:complete
MKPQKSLEKLEEIANDSGYGQQQNYETLDTQLQSHSSNMSIKKSDQIAAQAMSLYGDDQQKVFDTWNAGTSDFDLNKDTKNYYWKKYSELAGSPEIAKDALSSQVRKKLSSLETTSEKEYYIRDNLNKWPDWLTKEYEPSLANLMMVNQTKDMLKGETVYKKATEDKLNSLLQSSYLSPNIAEEDHVKDLLKLETLGFLSGATIVDGRVGVTNKNQKFQPAFSIKNASEITDESIPSSPAESAFLRDAVQTDVKDAVSMNLKESRSRLKSQHDELRFTMLSEVRQGNVDIDRWGDVASMIESPSDDSLGSLLFLFEEGLLGMLDQKTQGTDEPVKDKEINDMVMLAFTKYANLFGEQYNV